MELAKLQEKIKEVLSEKRYLHSLGVQQTAEELARRFDADVYKAGVAGLLHDCAREMPNDHLLKWIADFDIVMDSLEWQNAGLMHAAVGAHVAECEYGVQDREISRAIMLHTTGGVNMSKLDKIIFLADFIEPRRSYPGVGKLRKLAAEDLDRAVLAAYDQTICHLIRKRRLIHPASFAGRNSLLLTLNS